MTAKTAKCDFCGIELAPKEKLKHHWDEHREEMLKISARRKNKKKPAKGSDQPTAKQKTDTPNLVEAAMLEFVGQTIQVPNTPALIYGYFCAKKMGFEGSIAEFLQEVIDDFYEARGINYYKEVMEWEIPGKTITPEEKPQQLVAERA